MVVKFVVDQKFNLVPSQWDGHDQIDNAKHKNANSWRDAAHGIQHDEICKFGFKTWFKLEIVRYVKAIH